MQSGDCQSGRWRAPGIGSNQSWQNVTASRALSISYKNTTPRSIQISIYVQSTAANSVLLVDSELRAYFLGNDPNEIAQFTAIIPVGSTYFLSVGGTVYALAWHAMRSFCQYAIWR